MARKKKNKKSPDLIGRIVTFVAIGLAIAFVVLHVINWLNFI